MWQADGDRRALEKEELIAFPSRLQRQIVFAEKSFWCERSRDGHGAFLGHEPRMLDVLRPAGGGPHADTGRIAKSCRRAHLKALQHKNFVILLFFGRLLGEQTGGQCAQEQKAQEEAEGGVSGVFHHIKGSNEGFRGLDNHPRTAFKDYARQALASGSD